MGLPLDIRFFVAGKPVPKGNHAAFPIARGPCPDCGGRGAGCKRRNCIKGVQVGTVITDDGGKELEAWEQFVKVCAISARNAGGFRLVEPPSGVEVRIVFLSERPDSHYTGKGALSAEGLRRPLPTTKPDWDKLSRSTVDALTGAIVTDDSQIASARVAKVYTEGKKGALVRVRLIAAPDDWVTAELNALGHTLPTTQGSLLI